MLYLHETLDVPLYLQQEFFGAAQSRWRPAMRDLGARPIGLWQHSSIKGDPSELIALWELDDWSHAERLAAASASGSGHALRAWHDGSGAWVRQRRTQLLRQRASEAVLRQLERPDTPPQFCFHETMHIEPGREQDYVRAMEIQLGPAMHNTGLRMYGEFQPVFETGRILNLWSVPHGFDSMAVLGREKTGEIFSGLYWMEIGIALRKHWRSVWLMPAPVRLDGCDAASLQNKASTLNQGHEVGPEDREAPARCSASRAECVQAIQA